MKLIKHQISSLALDILFLIPLNHTMVLNSILCLSLNCISLQNDQFIDTVFEFWKCQKMFCSWTYLMWALKSIRSTNFSPQSVQLESKCALAPSVKICLFRVMFNGIPWGVLGLSTTNCKSKCLSDTQKRKVWIVKISYQRLSKPALDELCFQMIFCDCLQVWPMKKYFKRANRAVFTPIVESHVLIIFLN